MSHIWLYVLLQCNQIGMNLRDRIDIDQFLHCNLYFFSVRFGSIEAQPFAFVDQNGQSLLVTTLTLFSGLLSTMNVKLIKSSWSVLSIEIKTAVINLLSAQLYPH